MLRKAVNYSGIIGVKVRKLGEGLVSYLPGYLSYGVYLRVENFRLVKGAALSVYDGTGAVGYEALTGKFKAVYLIFRPVSIYDVVSLYRSDLLSVKFGR